MRFFVAFLLVLAVARADYFEEELFEDDADGEQITVEKAIEDTDQECVRRIRDGLFRFERNKVLLYSIRAHIGMSAYDSFLKSGHGSIPSDGSVPNLFRSDLLDNLASTISTTGYTRIVAEMRKGGAVVARVEFDASKTASIDKTNWFSAANVISSFPFSITKSSFNFFSVQGHDITPRRFFINFLYNGCPRDKGLWVVLDYRDNCPWAHRHWTGSAPSLIYNNKGKDVPFENNAVGVADQFLIYLTGSGPDKYAANLCSLPEGVFQFERRKILLYTIKAKIGKSAYDTFINPGHNSIPADRSLPNLFRSDGLDSLTSLIKRTRYNKIVAEMRKGGEVVARVVFDVSNTDGITKENWFSASRVVSSFPFSIGTSRFNYFSVRGHAETVRRFFINFVYKGCPGDIGFWVVLDGWDPCTWANKGWTGSAPVLVYNKKGKDAYFQSGAADEADRFLIYLWKD